LLVVDLLLTLLFIVVSGQIFLSSLSSDASVGLFNLETTGIFNCHYVPISKRLSLVADFGLSLDRAFKGTSDDSRIMGFLERLRQRDHFLQHVVQF